MSLPFDKILAVLMVLLFTVLSGLADGQGFLHAARVWDAGRPVPLEILKSSLGYAAGVVCYWFAIRYLNRLVAVSPEVQTLGWFAATIVGVALFSGSFLKWRPGDWLLGVAVMAGVGWLMVRTGK
jgi:hypothetical protein